MLVFAQESTLKLKLLWTTTALFTAFMLARADRELCAESDKVSVLLELAIWLISSVVLPGGVLLII